MHTLEHLDSVALRKELRMQPEHTIANSLRYPVDEFGHLVAEALTRVGVGNGGGDANYVGY